MGPHLTPHTPHSDQISSPVQPQVSHGKDSDVSFHTAAYSRWSHTETAQAGASEEDPQTRNPWAFTPSQSPRSLLFLLSLWLLPPCSLCPSTSLAHGLYLLCYLAVFPSVHSPGWCYPPPHPLLFQRLEVHASLLRLLPRALHFNLHLSLQLVSPATWARCIPQHSAVMGN